MKTENIFNFEFIDGSISMHVRLTKYFVQGGVQFRLSHHNAMRNRPYEVSAPTDQNDGLQLAKKLRAQCYADMCSFLQQAS